MQQDNMQSDNTQLDDIQQDDSQLDDIQQDDSRQGANKSYKPKAHAMTENELSSHIVKSALAVHREMGPGLLESIYENALFYELSSRGIDVIQQEPVPAFYKGKSLGIGYRLDLWLEKKVIIEIKAVSELHDVHLAQILTYLKLTDNKLGLLINFNVPLIKDGIQRVVNGL